MDTISKRKILLLGKLPPPYMGPSVAFEILINSRLKDIFELYHLDIKVNQQLDSLGKWSLRKLFINIQKYKELKTILSGRKPELVLIPVSQSAIGFIKDSFFILICSLFPTKILIQLRGGNFKNWFNNSSLLMRSYVKLILRKTNGVIVQGNILKKLFEEFYNEENIYVVPNGCDFKFEQGQIIKTGTVKITYLGNLQASKGIEDVIEAVRILNSTHKDKFVLEVTGAWRNDSTKEHCLKLVHDHSLPVKFMNSKTGEEKLDQLSSSDIFVFTPREPEGHPWVIIEAMAAGLPVISTDQGAITESVIEGMNGFIVLPKNPESITEKMRILIDNVELRTKMGANSRNFYLSKFTENHMVENYFNTFHEVLKRS